MAETTEMKIIARIHSDFTDKFGIPRQSGLVEELEAAIVFEPEYRDPSALRGLEGYSHLWLLWQFSENVERDWSPTVRPPRLGGNKRVGVFASRSPFRPNPIGLSAVKIKKLDLSTPKGPVIWVSGADILDNTPIYDIKPYLAYVDSLPEAKDGFALQEKAGQLKVEIPPEILAEIPKEKQAALKEILAQDPRPGYQDDSERIYKLKFAGREIAFKVEGNTLKVIPLADDVNVPPEPAW
ncbi:MAG: tRNA (N6-threonylcarbamoyladenosine(37)-N6)-methyltransferase TrmO [Bacillota bacterium]|nr:tRNA (N6-threonylcarbamoyladenosine(37)-N6)-methyltransferase TrmO [Bacillota bacterium]